MTKNCHAIATLSLVLIAVLLGYTGRDDSHITYFVADAIANGHGIINYSGDNIEQSSTFLYTLFLGFFSFLSGIKAASIGPVLSPATLVLAAFTTAFIVRQYNFPRHISIIPFFAPPVIYWGLSGMENPLYLLFLLLFCFFCERSINSNRPAFQVSLFAVAALSSLTRPEAALVVLCIAGGNILLGAGWKNTARVTAITIVGVLAAIFLKWLSGFGIFPNPVTAKQALPFNERLASGLVYFHRTFRDLPASSVLVFLFFVASAFRLSSGKLREPGSQFLGISLLAVFAVSSFAFLSGGDWMESGRFLTAAYFFPVLAFLCLAKPKSRAIAAIVFMAASAFDLANLSSNPYGGIPYFTSTDVKSRNFRPSPFEKKNVIHSRDISFIDKTIETLMASEKKSITLGSIQAGMVPYYLIRNVDKRFNANGINITFIDFYGLSSTEVHSCRDNWRYDPYKSVKALDKCLNQSIDYIYDLDSEGWPRLNTLKRYGCKEEFRDKVTLKPWFWKETFVGRQFLVRCDNVF